MLCFTTSLKHSNYGNSKPLGQNSALQHDIPSLHPEIYQIDSLYDKEMICLVCEFRAFAVFSYPVATQINLK